MQAFHATHMKHSPEEMAAHFKAADRNGDGFIDPAEAKADMPMLAEHFAEVDANHDGKVTLDEMKAHHGQHMKAQHPEPLPPPRRTRTVRADRRRATSAPCARPGSFLDAAAPSAPAAAAAARASAACSSSCAR